MPACHVRLALARKGGAELAVAARRNGYEPVALADDDAYHDDEDEPRGLARAREALHAHEWPGLRLHSTQAPPPAAAEDEEWEWHSAPAADFGDFASALGALGAARAAVASSESREQRVQRASALLAAFCRAMPGSDER